jgi:hypothetical protein
MQEHTSQPPPAWRTLAELVETTGRNPSTVRQWMVRNVPQAERGQWDRPGGGSAEWWLSPAGVAIVLGHFPAAVSTGASVHDAPVQEHAATDAPVQPDTSALVDALVHAHARELAALRDSRDELRRERDALALRVDRLAEERDLAHQRADGLRQQMQDLRAAVYRWHTAILRLTWWGRARGRLPEPPPELQQIDRLLAPPG